MKFSTPVNIPAPSFSIQPMEEMLFVGSCFADGIGRRFEEEKFKVTVNPFGTMYNPASVLHTLKRLDTIPRIVFLTLGTNHVYILKETGEIVDNCQKRPARLFEERELSVDECADYLEQCVATLLQKRADVQVIFTVSPIRYAKYGFHGNQLSKATLLLAIDKTLHNLSPLTSHPSPLTSHPSSLSYFPAYEIVLDELRDYRFYAPDMLHPSPQTVEYIFERLTETYLSSEARQFIKEWRPVKEALAHRPLHPESQEYQQFLAKTKEKILQLTLKYPGLSVASP
ncbi:MAG: GSCFA domain-containing protein [Prevotella sp.]|nr:GSCFA domain-containing protein [Prevotella sp.]